MGAAATVDYDALAAKYGAKDAPSVPDYEAIAAKHGAKDAPTTHEVDYDALAAKYGASDKPSASPDYEALAEKHGGTDQSPMDHAKTLASKAWDVAKQTAGDPAQALSDVLGKYGPGHVTTIAEHYQNIRDLLANSHVVRDTLAPFKDTPGIQNIIDAAEEFGNTKTGQFLQSAAGEGGKAIANAADFMRTPMGMATLAAGPAAEALATPTAEVSVAGATPTLVPRITQFAPATAENFGLLQKAVSPAITAGQLVSPAIRAGFAGAAAPGAIQETQEAIAHPTPESAGKAAAAIVAAATPVAPELGSTLNPRLAERLDAHNAEAQRLIAEDVKAAGWNPGIEQEAAQSAGQPAAAPPKNPMTVQTDHGPVVVSETAQSSIGRPYFSVSTPDRKVVYGGTAPAVQDFLHQAGARPLGGAETEAPGELNPGALKTLVNAGVISAQERANILSNEDALSQADIDRIHDAARLLKGQTPTYPENRPGTVQVQNAPSARKMAGAPEVPETGIPERVARVQDARERLSNELFEGRSWNDPAISPSQRLVIDSLVSEGHGFAVQPPAPVGELTPDTFMASATSDQGEKQAVAQAKPAETKESGPQTEDIITGTINAPLTADGHKEAEQVAESKVDGIKEVFSTPMARGQQTADHIEKAGAGDVEVKTADALGPWNLGQFQGQRQSEVDSQINQYIQNPDTPVPGGESYNAFKDPLIGHIQDQIADWKPGEKLLNITHSIGVHTVLAWTKNGAPEDKAINVQAMLDRKKMPPVALWRIDPETKKMAMAKNTDKPGIYILRHADTPLDNVKPGSQPTQVAPAPQSEEVIQRPTEAVAEGAGAGNGTIPETGVRQLNLYDQEKQPLPSLHSSWADVDPSLLRRLHSYMESNPEQVKTERPGSYKVTAPDGSVLEVHTYGRGEGDIYARPLGHDENPEDLKNGHLEITAWNEPPRNGMSAGYGGSTMAKAKVERTIKMVVKDTPDPGGATEEGSEKSERAADRELAFYKSADLAKVNPKDYELILARLRHNTHAEDTTPHLLKSVWAPSSRSIGEAAGNFAIAKAVREGILSPVIEDGKYIGRLAINRDKIPAVIEGEQPIPRAADVAKEASREKPSLGVTGREIYQAWKRASEAPQMPRSVVVGVIPGEGVYDFRNGMIVRITTHYGRQGNASTYSPATDAEIGDIHHAIDTGTFQVEERQITGALGVRKFEGAGKTLRVLHQATGTPLPEFLDSKDGKAWATKVGYNSSGTPATAPEAEHKFSSTQFNLPPKLARAITSFAKRIPDEDLAEDGRENEPHVTLKYGLHSDDPAATADVLSGSDSIPIKLGRTSVFKNDDADVLKMDVTSPELQNLNQKVSDAVEHTDTFPDYRPHVTIAYLKPGVREKYAGKFVSGATGAKANLDTVLFSNHAGDKTPIKLGAVQASETPRSASAPEGENEAEATSERGAIHPDLMTLGLNRFVDQDVIPTIHEAASAVTDTWGDIQKELLPTARGKSAKQAALIMQHRLSEMARVFNQATKATATARQMFLKKGDDFSKQFILDYFGDENAPLPKTGNADLDSIAQKIRELLDERRAAVQNLGTGKLKGFYTNYFPRIWKDSRKAERVFAAFFGKRSLEGGKSFLKQRSYPTIQDALDAGLEPITWNPIDLMLTKVREMDRYIMAHTVLNDWKQSGLARFVDARKGNAPRGWTKIPDAIGVVYGPSVQMISEFPNEGLYRALTDTAGALGIKLERGFLKGMGQAVGKARQGGGVKTLHGTAEDVLAHEIGHQIDWLAGSGNRFLKYGDPALAAQIKQARATISDRNATPTARKSAQALLRGQKDVIRRQVTFSKELRALADLRSGPASYTHKREEKMALLAEMWVGARETFKDTAPHVFEEWKKFLGENPKLHGLRDIKGNTEVISIAQPYDVGGLVIKGNWFAPEGAARIMHNYLTPGLSNKAAYRALIGLNNVINQFQLGLSGFHVGFTSADAIVSQAALSIEMMLRGDVRKALAAAPHAMIAPIESFLRGDKLLKEWYKPGSQSGPIAEIVKNLVAAGGRVEMDQFYQTAIADKMAHAWNNGNWLGALWRVPFAGVEAFSDVIMKQIVPRQKLGVFANMAAYELERLGPGATFEETRAAMAKAWDSVENRLGQMTYDNLFWNRFAKDVAMLSVRSVGWNLGTIREIGGGAIDMVRVPIQLAGGTPPKEVNLKRLTYVIALAVVSAIMGAIYQYLATGKAPQELKDYYFPRTGQLDEAGRPQRVSLPTYVKDVYHYWTEPGKTITDKVAPIWNMFGEMIHNEDFYGNKIRNEDDPLIKQMLEMLEHVGKTMEPFGFRNFQRETDLGAPMAQRAQQFFGIAPAPSSLEKTKAELLAAKIQGGHFTGGRTSEQAARRTAEATIRRLAASGQDYGNIARDYAAAGVLTHREINTAAKTASIPPLGRTFKQMRLEDALRVWDAATPEERMKLRPLLMAKAAKMKDLPLVERAILAPKVRDALRVQ